MNLKNLLALVIGLALLVAAIFLVSYLRKGGPGDAAIKGIATREMQAHFKGCAIDSIVITRGNMFRSQGQRGRVPYNAPVYPVSLKISYTLPTTGGVVTAPRHVTRRLFFYQDAPHRWARDNDVN